MKPCQRRRRSRKEKKVIGRREEGRRSRTRKYWSISVLYNGTYGGVLQRIRACRERLRRKGIRKETKLYNRCLGVERWGRPNAISLSGSGMIISMQALVQLICFLDMSYLVSLWLIIPKNAWDLCPCGRSLWLPARLLCDGQGSCRNWQTAFKLNQQWVSLSRD